MFRAAYRVSRTKATTFPKERKFKAKKLTRQGEAVERIPLVKQYMAEISREEDIPVHPYNQRSILESKKAKKQARREVGYRERHILAQRKDRAFFPPLNRVATIARIPDTDLNIKTEIKTNTLGRKNDCKAVLYELALLSTHFHPGFRVQERAERRIRDLLGSEDIVSESGEQRIDHSDSSSENLYIDEYEYDEHYDAAGVSFDAKDARATEEIMNWKIGFE